GDLYRQTNGEQVRFEQALARDEKAIIKWLTKRMDDKKYTGDKPDIFKNNLEEQSSEDGKEAVFDPKTASQTGLAAEDSFFTALLRSPKVVPRIRTCQLTPEEQ
ncbi:hypothetical protein PFISCL1PPCAC_4530, partial [Pristionchus fissidentatus]